MSKKNQQLSSKKLPIPLLNGETATFDCSFGRGCEGLCCKNGRPGLQEEELKKLELNRSKIMPHLLPKVQKLVEKTGFVTNRVRSGLPLAGVVDGWCIFFNQGCVLHKIGAVEGDYLKYKPEQCAIFPLLWDDQGQWYVRQWNYKGEEWNDLFCLNPANTQVKAAQSLQHEMNLAAQLDVSVKPE